MLKRFMSWLLHRLQKLLSPLSGRRRHAHSPVPFPGAALADQKDRRDQSTAYSESETVSSSLGSTPPTRGASKSEGLSAEADAYRHKDTVAVYEPITVNLNTSTSASELIASGALNYLLEVPDTEQLPEIHDLLPAIEPEISAVEPDLPERDLAEPAAERAGEVPIGEKPEGLLEETAVDTVVEPPAQAILFSFDIVEAEDSTDLESESLPEDSSLEERTLADGVPDDSVEVPETGQVGIVIEASPEADTAVEPVLASAAQPAEAIGNTKEPIKQGIVKLLFMLKQGNYHGYVVPDDGTKDILFHQKYINADIFDRLERGSRVVVAVKYIEGKAHATSVDLL